MEVALQRHNKVIYVTPLAVGVRPMIQGVLLWIIISVGSLLYILFS